MPKIYAGYTDGLSTPGPCIVLVRAGTGWETLPVPDAEAAGERWWGRGGPGALALARAILADHFGHLPSADLCRQFAWEVVGRWPQGYCWLLDTVAIDTWLARTAARLARAARPPASP
jgi:hypothetical protein